MSMNNMQLKEESLLGGQEVLSDINPITNTLSIDDSASGEKLNITIARMWEAINNKLSRIVNSVNGRSGVVVLTSDDVGLGNVDNVSFYDIKQWVIDQIESVFGNKRLRLYETFQNAMDAKDLNDRALAWTPFYCDHYDNDDTRSIIGVFGWDSGSQTLTIDYRRINTIGFADNSIIYRTTPNDYGSEYGIPVGGIGVNIYNEEREDDQVLYVEGRNDSSVDKRSAGLRIDHNKLGSRVYYCETPYGNVIIDSTFDRWDFSGTADQFLYRYGDDKSTKGYRVKIYINDEYIVPKYITSRVVSSSEVIGDPYFFINKNWKEYSSFRANDIIIIRFSNFIRTTSTSADGEYHASAAGEGVCVDFSNRQPMIGYVTKKSFSDDYDFDIHFYDLRPNTHGFGITTYDTMLDRDVPDTVLGISVYKSSNTPTNKGNALINMSGINAQYLYNNGTFQSEANRSNAIKNKKPIHVYTPWGRDAVSPVADGGLAIETDGSICIQARYQRYPTYQRNWFTPLFVKNKYYEKRSGESGDIYELLELPPSDWDSNWDIYYVKDPNDDTAYIQAIGIPPVYSRNNCSRNSFKGGTPIENQYAVGSLMGTNYSYFNSEYSNPYSDYWKNSKLDLLHPTGTNPDDGIIGTLSEISINLTKVSTMRPGESESTGYEFYNLSGLKMDMIYGGTVGTSTTSEYKNKFFLYRGMPDMRDAYGKSVRNVFDKGSTTYGISINVGRFLEITPKKTHRAETYWDGGKVQVRVGSGLTEQIEEYDVSDIFKNDKSYPIPKDWPFDKDQFIDAWYQQSDEFYLRIFSDDVDKSYVDYPCNISHRQLTTKPDDWDTDWTNYEYNVGTDDDPDYVFLPDIPDVTIGFDPTDYIYMGPYYKPHRKFPYGCMTIKEIHDLYATGIYDSMRIIWKRPTNRITLDLDKNTLDFDEHGKITVIGGSGNNHQPGRNIRVVDTRGIYFDTMPYVIDSDTGLPKYPVEEVMSLGPGLKLTGAGTKVPITMKLWGYVKDAPVSSKRATYSTLLLEIWDNMSVGERATYFRNYCTDDNQGLGPIYIGNVLTYNGFKSFSDTVRNAIKLLPNTTTGYSQDDFDMDITQTAADFQEMITSQEVVAYNDDRYNIPTYQYLKSDIRPYLSMSADDIRDMLENLLLGVETMYDGTDESIPEDWDNKKIKILQYFADHYGMGTISSLNHDVNMAMWNSKLPYINDQPHISTDPFPLDWAFSFFAQAILIGGEWKRVVEGRYEWTAVTNRPGTWDAVITEDYTTNSLNYFFSVDDNKKLNTELLIIPEYKPTAFWIIHDITLENGWRLEFDNLSGSTVSEWNTTYAQYAFMTTFRKLEDSNAPGDWETNYSKYFTINRLHHGSDPNEGSPLLLKHVESETTPTYEPNVYYVQDNTGTINAWVRIDRRVAYNSDEIGTASNPVRYAPTFETNKYYKKIAVEGGDPTYQLLESKPDDWYTNFMSYFTKYDVSGSESTYDPVIGSITTVYASITAPGRYWTRSLVPST